MRRNGKGIIRKELGKKDHAKNDNNGEIVMEVKTTFKVSVSQKCFRTEQIAP